VQDGAGVRDITDGAVDSAESERAPELAVRLGRLSASDSDQDFGRRYSRKSKQRPHVLVKHLAASC
jgi:hypothetical protein